MKFQYNPPNIVKNIFSEFIWETSNNKILLTFDDGPNPGITEAILSVLNRHNIKAIFFCVGQNVDRYYSLTKEIIHAGHTIGNHSINHNKLTKLSYSESLVELNSLNETIMEKFDYNVKYFRPPYGRINFETNKLMKSTGMKCVMWSLLTYDYKKELKKVKFSIDKYLQNNSLIVLHDNIKTKEIIIDSIEYIVKKADQNGFEFGEPEECLN
jgi:peptidoglycan/xylan/chitin deacetylase (PgdA/CDA1 family)